MKSVPAETPGTTVWQEKLLPSMRNMVIILAVFFFIASLAQIIYLHTRMETNPKVELKEALEMLDYDVKDKTITPDHKLKFVIWKTLSQMEASIIENRYHQTNISLMSRIWTKYLGFVTGMMLALVGAIFILGKLKETESKLDAASSLWKFSFTTASPGLLLAVLGSILMITTILTHHEITTIDTPQYHKLYPVIQEVERAKTKVIMSPAQKKKTFEQAKKGLDEMRTQQKGGNKKEE